MSRADYGVAAVFGRAAPRYGRIGQDFFAYFGARIVAMTGVTSARSVLDVGCGTGAALTVAAAACGDSARVVGVDVSPEMLLRAGEAFVDRDLKAAFSLADAGLLPFPQGSFDTVLSSFALTYFPSPEGAAAEIRRVLRPKGRVGICVSDGWWFQGDPGWRWHEQLLTELRAPLGEGRFRDPAAVVDLLTGAGFRVGDVVTETFPLEWADVNEWWQAGWSHGYREVLEAFSPSVLEEYRTRSFERLRCTPLRGRLEVVLATGDARADYGP